MTQKCSVELIRITLKSCRYATAVTSADADDKTLFQCLKSLLSLPSVNLSRSAEQTYRHNLIREGEKKNCTDFTFHSSFAHKTKKLLIPIVKSKQMKNRIEKKVEANVFPSPRTFSVYFILFIVCIPIAVLKKFLETVHKFWLLHATDIREL